MTVTAAAFIVGAYLLGAIPSSYLMARWLKGVDIRTTGSGNVGASNLSEHVGRWIGIPVGFFDLIVKATVPILLAQFLDQGLTVQAAVGLAAVLGPQLVSLPADDGRTWRLDGHRHHARLPHVAGNSHSPRPRRTRGNPLAEGHGTLDVRHDRRPTGHGVFLRLLRPLRSRTD